jgi:hypothetical protein
MGVNEGPTSRFAKVLRAEEWLYLGFAAVATLYAALGFLQARSQHLMWAEAARQALDENVVARRIEPIWWSAPLDDTFIHFDFARSFAQWHPFEWIPGGGYSSGATSWLYPMLLSLAYVFGAHGQALGVAADILACAAVFGSFWALRSLFVGLPRWTVYLLPALVLSSGVLGWSLWSGMEFALFVGIWSLTMFSTVRCGSATSTNEYGRWCLGVAGSGLLLVMTRPEALSCVALCSIYACSTSAAQRRWHSLSLMLGPAIALTLIRSSTNLVLTGSAADAGAIVKLLPLRPFLESREVTLRWLANLGFQLTRISVYHTSDDPVWSWQIWALLVLALIPSVTRKKVLLLVLQAACWMCLVAQNEYVRYQNDRYTMPALYFLLVAVSLGVGALLTRFTPQPDARSLWPRASFNAAVAILSLSFFWHQLPRLAQQHWLFGRACRNIAEQQIRVGQLLKAGQFGPTRRVLVGDAGAIPYFSELPGVDAIGLGGTERLPFAKAVNLGVGATVELIERLAPDARPDKMAIYPSWWDLLPVWFGRRVDEVRIRGNVICGAVDKVVYETDWRGLTEFSRPTTDPLTTRILDELDFADLVSETAHRYHLSSKHSGYVVMNVLPDPTDPGRDVFDAGRLVFSGTVEQFYLSGLRPGQPASLVFRTAPKSHMAIRVRVDGRDAGRIELAGGDSWEEPRIRLDAKHLRETIFVEVLSESSEHQLHHLWVTSP